VPSGYSRSSKHLMLAPGASVDIWAYYLGHAYHLVESGLFPITRSDCVTTRGMNGEEVLLSLVGERGRAAADAYCKTFRLHTCCRYSFSHTHLRIPKGAIWSL
jgi:hypothetical protein